MGSAPPPGPIGAAAIPPAATRRPVLLTATTRWIIALSVLAWLALSAAHRLLHFIQPGSDLVVQAKYGMATTTDLFGAQSGSRPIRVVVVGNSRVLAGFIPALFDQETGAECASWNMGVPGVEEFSSLITALCEHSRPTHLLLIDPPQAGPQASTWQSLTDDDLILERVFPFRRLPRDVFNFLRLSGRYGGPRAYWDRNRELIAQTLADRGYFFIASQSLFPGDRLPDDFCLPSDHPARPDARDYQRLAGPAEELQRLAARHGVAVLLVPPALRDRAAAPAATDPKRIPAGYPLPVVGPDYLSYPNRCFSDFVHLNREGADRYTRDLAALLKDRLVAPRPAPPGEGQPHAVQ
jgi:hypothetical protein